MNFKSITETLDDVDQLFPNNPFREKRADITVLVDAPETIADVYVLDPDVKGGLICLIERRDVDDAIEAGAAMDKNNATAVVTYIQVAIATRNGKTDPERMITSLLTLAENSAPPIKLGPIDGVTALAVCIADEVLRLTGDSGAEMSDDAKRILYKAVQQGIDLYYTTSEAPQP